MKSNINCLFDRDDVGIDIAEFMRIADFVSECPSDSLKTDGPPHIHIDIALRTIGEWQNTVISDFTEGNLKDLGNDIYRTILRLLVFYKSNKD